MPPKKRPANATLLALAADSRRCEGCGKPAPICVCDRVERRRGRTRVVILQHPQEDDSVLGTASLLATALESVEIRRGLSWASLEHALDTRDVDRTQWAVLAAGTGAGTGQGGKAAPPRPLPSGRKPASAAAPVSGVTLVDRHGEPLDLATSRLRGFLVLDGTWSQAKTLWWRNPWLLKLPRLRLTPREPSLYGRLRREPRREWVSTLEAVADVLPALGEPEATRDHLRLLLRTMLQRARDAVALAASHPGAPK